MPIQEQNIKFLKSQVMDDVPEGGGAATGTEIEDGVMNNVFEDISDLDRAMGRFNLRKLFLAVRTLSTDLFGGAKTVVTAVPEDPAIGYTLFTTNDPFDTRDQAASRVEAYLFKGPMWNGALYENHITGMRQIRVIQREGTELPPRGRTLTLVQYEGEANEKEQYVRVTEVEAKLQTFTDPATGKDFVRLIVSMDLSDGLRFDFDGHTPNISDSYNYNTGARLRDTNVADATRYFGAQYTSAAAGIGDKIVRAQSMFTQLVPAAQSEEPLANQPLNPTLIQTLDAGTRDVEVPQQAHTLARDVTPENRRYNWVETLAPVPGPNAYSISYMAQGNWYMLTDNGSGVISGSDPGFGSGTIDYVTGNTSVTLGALPDAGSQIVHIYGSPVHYEVRSGAEQIAATTVSWPFQLENYPVVGGSFTMTWAEGEATKTASADASGQITGDAVGEVDLTTGEGSIALAVTPNRGSDMAIDYQWYEADDPGESVAGRDVIASGPSMTLTDTPAANSLRIEMYYTSERANYRITAIESEGQIVVPKQGVGSFGGGQGQSAIIDAQVVIGTLTGTDITLNKTTITVKKNLYGWGLAGAGWQRKDHDMYLDQTIDAVARYVRDGVTSTSTAATDTTPITALEIDLTPQITDGVVAESVRFTLAGKSYDDRQGGLVTDIVSDTGSGLVAGGIEYDRGLASVTFWNDATPTNTAVTSLLTIYGEWTATEGFFRTASAPLKPESLQITGTSETGIQVVATADQNGDFVNEWCQGTVNYTFGTAAVRFGKLLEDQYLSAEEKEEDWYRPQDVEAGFIYKPMPMVTSTLRYNAVAFSYIPLDASIVGIDAVRLPSDGRVPIYRPGNVVMVMHPQDTAPATVATGGTITTRPRVGWVRVIDAAGDNVTEGYSLDRATGIVTFDDVSAMAMPITVRHTVGDLRLVTDVQITGEIQLSRELTHNYPANESIVASCLIHGDRRARVSDTWDQKNWDGSWKASIVGDEATATLNLIDYPITVTNEGCDTDRWIFRCTSSGGNAWELISEKRGLIWQGIYSQSGEDVAPINPRTRGPEGQGGTPYMVIPAAANGGGWATGNVIRINTVGAIADFWIARAIQQSDEPLDDGADGCEIYALGNIDRP